MRTPSGLTDRYALHNAAEAGDEESIRRMLASQDEEYVPGVSIPGLALDHDVNLRDDDNLTPLHAALLAHQLPCVKALLDHNASLKRKVDGVPVIHIAVTIGGTPGQAQFSLEACKLLIAKAMSPIS